MKIKKLLFLASTIATLSITALADGGTPVSGIVSTILAYLGIK